MAAVLNGVQVAAVKEVLDKMDQLTEEWGTHLIMPATFQVYDEEGQPCEVRIDYSDGLHRLVS